MDELTTLPGEISCTVAGRRYRESARYISTFLAHVQVFGDQHNGSFVTLASAGLSDEEIALLR